jgi:hypothetical protein
VGGQVMLDEWTVQRGREWCSTNGRSRLVEGRTKERQPTPWVLNSSKDLQLIARVIMNFHVDI